jgi:hypothetical protein
MEPKPRYDQALEYEQRGEFAKTFVFCIETDNRSSIERYSQVV